MFRIPPITKNLIIINVILFLASYVFKNLDLQNACALQFFLMPNFHIWQFVTYMFMHGSMEHLFFNMLALWMFGGAMEMTWGARRFLLFYFICGIGAGLTQEIMPFLGFYPAATVGASGSIYGILLAFGMTYPNNEMIVFPIPIPIKAKYFVIFYVVIELFSGIAGSTDGVAHFAHLGGMLFGFMMIMYWRYGHKGASFGQSGESSFGWFKKAVKRDKGPKMSVHYGKREQEFEYNLCQKERSAEIDRILDKLRQSGYESLTVDEKKKLFDASQN